VSADNRYANVGGRRSSDPDADLEGNLADWRRFRRQKRVADVHWIDVLYPAYLTGIFGFAVVAVLSSMVGDEVLTAGQVETVRVDGPGWIGVAAAFAVALGLRSGSRGGPLALERAEVRHVLLAPVDRAAALRVPALKQLRFLAFVGLVVGAIAGNLAAQRLPGSRLAWIATGALAAVVLIGLSVGTALVSSGLRIPRWLASLAGLVLLVLSFADALDRLPASPGDPFGQLVLWPLDFAPVGLIPVLVALALVASGLAVVGRSSLESAEQRSALVGQLRFAATLQDLRTVIVLRRQLAMELPRLRPWARLRARGTDRLPVFTRGVRGLLRFPAARVVRLMALGVVAGLCLRAMWSGTTPLFIVSGLALFVAGLDTTESLAQEVDHPSRRDASPFDASEIHLRHVPVAVLGQLAVAAVAAGVAALPGGGEIPADVAALGILSLAVGGLSGALVSVLAGQASVNDSWSLAPPEAQGMRLAFRTAWPPALAVLGALPWLFARDAIEDGRTASEGAVPWLVLSVVAFVLVCGWVRLRAEIGEWFRVQMEQNSAQSPT